jgi:flagellar hook-associated protein 2
VTGTAAPSGSTTITPDSNDTLSMTIDGKVATVKLSAGTYTAQELMTHVQSQVNVNAAFKDAGIKVTISAAADGIWTITSDAYGSKSNVSISGNGAANLMGQASSTGIAGVNAEGTIGGVAATGDGQLLTGAAGSAHDGLRLTILGGAIGARGTVRLSHGAATTLKELTDKYLGSAGTITSYTQSLQNSVKSVEKARDAMNDRLAKTEARYRAQFTALDQMLGKMNTTSVFLSQQLG